MARVTVEGYLCERCSHVWVPQRRTVSEPKICPRCKSAYWNKPRKLDWPAERRAAQHDERSRKPPD